MLGVETLKPRLIEAVLGADPLVHAVPTESTDQERAERVEAFLNWQLRSEIPLDELVPQAAHLFLQPGTVVAKITWQRERWREKAIRTFPPGTELEAIFRALFGPETPDLKPDGPLAFRGILHREGHTPLDVALRLRFLDTGIQVLLDQERVREGPRVDLLDPLDVIVPARGGHDVQRLPWIQERMWLTADAIRRKAQRGEWDAEAVEALLRQEHATGEDETQSGAQAVREARDQAEGLESLGASDVRSAQQYEIIADYRRMDVDEDGFEEEVIHWFAPALPGRILGWDYLANRHASGQRPFVVERYFPIPFRWYGLSFAEVVQDIQDEINTIHNQRVDWGTIQNLPMFFYRSSMTFAPQTYRLRPGEGVPVDDPTRDILIPRWQGSPAFGQAEEALLYQYYERLTGLTDLALGRQPSRVGATRTATGVASLLSEAGLRFKTAMEAFQRFWRKCFEHILALDQQYLPPGREFRVTGKLPEFVRLRDRQEIAGRFDLRLAATSESLNKEVLRQDAAIILQTLMQPVFLQAGLIGPRGIRRALHEFLRAYGRTEPGLYLEAEGAEMPRTPQEELALVASGLEMRAHPSVNLQEHLAVHMTQLRDPAVQAGLGQDGMRRLERLIQEELALAQAQQMALALQGPQGRASQPAIAGGQALNAQIGRQVAQEPSAPPAAVAAAANGAQRGPLA